MNFAYAVMLQSDSVRYDGLGLKKIAFVWQDLVWDEIKHVSKSHLWELRWIIYIIKRSMTQLIKIIHILNLYSKTLNVRIYYKLSCWILIDFKCNTQMCLVLQSKSWKPRPVTDFIDCFVLMDGELNRLQCCYNSTWDCICSRSDNTKKPNIKDCSL